eukprot:349961-Chlamydomonas_euryale.AAC.16
MTSTPTSGCAGATGDCSPLGLAALSPEAAASVCATASATTTRNRHSSRSRNAPATAGRRGRAGHRRDSVCVFITFCSSSRRNALWRRRQQAGVENLAGRRHQQAGHSGNDAGVTEMSGYSTAARSVTCCACEPPPRRSILALRDSSSVKRAPRAAPPKADPCADRTAVSSR